MTLPFNSVLYRRHNEAHSEDVCQGWDAFSSCHFAGHFTLIGTSSTCFPWKYVMVCPCNYALPVKGCNITPNNSTFAYFTNIKQFLCYVTLCVHNITPFWNSLFLSLCTHLVLGISVSKFKQWNTFRKSIAKFNLNLTEFSILHHKLLLKIV